MPTASVCHNNYGEIKTSLACRQWIPLNRAQTVGGTWVYKKKCINYKLMPTLYKYNSLNGIWEVNLRNTEYASHNISVSI